jgi:hypothetical protein
LAITDILKVFYAPHKVFKDIVKKPSYIAPLIVLVIFLVAQVGASYIVATRSFIEQTKPTADQMDVWTENSTLWVAGPGVAISENHVDFINASAYYNVTSIEFKVSNSSSIQMALQNLDGSVNCGADGFKNISFKLKIVEPNARPANVTLFLYSLSDSNFFTHDLTSEFSNNTINEWNNVTIPVGSGAWTSSGTPSWNNITSLRIDFVWDSASNIDLRVDGLFFRGIYEDPLVVYGSTYMLSTALNAVTPFLFQWLVLTALMYLLIKGLKGTVVWKPLMVAVGTALTILIVQALILVVSYSTLPNIYYPVEVLAGVPGEFNVAYQVILDQIATVTSITAIVQIVILAWNIILGALIVRAVTSAAPPAPPTTDESTPIAPQAFAWTKCFAVSGASVLLTLIILYFLGV